MAQKLAPLLPGLTLGLIGRAAKLPLFVSGADERKF